MHKKTTIADVAKAANVSTTTVSRALSNTGRIGKTTREKIVQIAAEMDFQPSALATGFIKSKTNNIGIIVPAATHDNFYENAYFHSFLQGVNTTADEKQYDILLSSGEEESTAIQSFINQQKADGLLLMRAYQDSAYITKLRETGFPFVVVGDPNIQDIHIVDTNNYETTYKLTKYLSEKSNGNIGFMSYDEHLCVTYERYSAYKQALIDTGHSVVPAFSVISSSKDTLRKFLEAFTNIHANNKCLIVSDHTSCITVLEYIHAHSIAIPQQLQLVVYNDNVMMRFHTPPITSVDTVAFEMGKIAAASLIDILEQKIPPTKKVIPSRIHYRQSTFD